MRTLSLKSSAKCKFLAQWLSLQRYLPAQTIYTRFVQSSNNPVVCSFMWMMLYMVTAQFTTNRTTLKQSPAKVKKNTELVAAEKAFLVYYSSSSAPRMLELFFSLWLARPTVAQVRVAHALCICDTAPWWWETDTACRRWSVKLSVGCAQDQCRDAISSKV